MRVFVHGLGQTAQSWEKTVQKLEDGESYCCVELSELVPKGEVTYSGLYRAFSDFCGRTNTALDICGLSLGAVLALNYAMEHPEKMHTLVLIAPQYRMPKALLRFQNGVFRLMPKSAFRAMGFEKEEVIRLCRGMAQLDFSEALRKVTCRVLVICGEKDRSNRKAAIGLAQTLQNAQLRMIAGAGHEVNLEAPEALAETLRSFFSKE